MPDNTLSVNHKFRSSLSEKLEYLKDQRRKIEPFTDPLTLSYDRDLSKLKVELDQQIQELHVQIHNDEYSSFCKSIDFVLGV